MNLGISLVDGIILAIIVGLIITNPSGDSAVGNSLTGFSTGTIKALEQPQTNR